VIDITYRICRVLALENLRDITEFVRIAGECQRGIEWYTLYFSIQASLTILLSIVWEPFHPDAQSWRTHINETTTWLRELRSMKQVRIYSLTGPILVDTNVAITARRVIRKTYGERSLDESLRRGCSQ
jgi:transcriptional regulatory protein GAL4